MIRMDQYELIRTAHYVYGKGIREIARDYGHSRKTIRKALSGMSPGYRRKKEPGKPVMGGFQEIIDGWLKEDRNRPRKQRHTAHRIYERLVLEYAFRGGESTVRRHVRERKAELGFTQKEAMVPLVVDVESGAEVDWGEAKVILDGKERKVKLFCMRSKYSGKIFVRAYLAERQEMFLDGHQHAFQYYGGVFKELVYDNLTTAVKRVLRGRQRIEQEQFRKFRAYYTFQARFCNPGKGNEKGGVEGTVGYVRRNFLVPMPQIPCLEVLNRQLLEKCVIHGQRVKNKECGQIIDTLHDQQKSQLIRLQKEDFTNFHLLEGRADKYQTVQVDRNRYSLPGSYVGHKLQIHLGCSELRIYKDRQLVAVHPRCLERGRWNLNPLHYLKTIGRKPGSFEDARPLKAWRKTWPPYYEVLLERLRKTRDQGPGTKAFIEVLKLHEIYPRDVVEDAVRLCVEKGAYCQNAVKHLIFKRLEKPLPDLGNMRVTGLPEPIYGQPSLSEYDRLMTPGGIA